MFGGRPALVLVVVALWRLSAEAREQPEVTVTEGALRGAFFQSQLKGRDFAAFQGVPYAEPPVGALRFKEAEPVKPWPGVLNATSYGPVCLQYSHFTQSTQFEIHGSEDCLYMNIFSPKLPTGNEGDNDLLDVIFYIHGGAFMFLAGHPFGPEYLLDENVVLVTFNYRLGPLGFLSTEDDVVPGNNGLKDQLLALKWVNNNIVKFGGNPKKITLAGTSAGGASVHYHVLSPLSKGLFSRGIIMSGAALNPWPLTENSLEKARKLSAELGCPTDCSSKMIDCLRRRPADHIVEKSKLFIPWLYSPFTPFGPVVETPGASAFLDKQPLDIIRSQAASDVPLLFSYTVDEGLYPGSEIILDEGLIKKLQDEWVDLLPHLLDYNYTVSPAQRETVAQKIKAFYFPENGQGLAAIRSGIIKMIGDRLFIVGIRESAKLHAEVYKAQSFAYVFSFKGSKRGFMKVDLFDGVSHGDDLAYLMKKDVPWGPIGDDEESQAMSRYMVDLWKKFIKGQLPKEWIDIKSSLPGLGYLEIRSGDEKKNEFKIDEDTAIEDFWNSLNFSENRIGRDRDELK